MSFRVIRIIFIVFCLFVLLSTGCQSSEVVEDGETAVSPTQIPITTPTATVLLEGLINPVGLEPLPDGSLLIAEEGTGEDDLSAGITLLLENGQHGRFLSNVPSSRDAGDLSGIPFCQMAGWHPLHQPLQSWAFSHPAVES